MKTLPLSEAKDRLSRIVNEVADRDERVMITRNGRPAAVMMSSSEFDSLLATLDLLSDPEIMAQIASSKRAMRRAPLYTLDELFRE